MIAIYGDNCIDRYIRPKTMELVGGNAVNVAIHLSDLGEDVRYLGVIGNDSRGCRIRKALEDRGVDCSQLYTRSGKTGMTVVRLRNGQRVFVEDSVGIQCPLILTPKALELAGDCSFLHCTVFTSWNIPWETACPRIVKEVQHFFLRGVYTSLDFSGLEKPKLAQQIGRWLNLAFVSKGELCSKRELEQTFKFFHECGIQEVVATLGARGSIYSNGKQLLTKKGIQIEVIDTLGAGDAYIANWLFGRSKGWSPEQCQKEATMFATKACLYFGAWPKRSQACKTVMN